MWRVFERERERGERGEREGRERGERERERERERETPVTRHQKLLLYRAAICPRLTWDVAVNDLPLSWVTSKLEAQATKYLKKWSGLAKSADTSCLYLPKSYGGLGLQPVSLLFKKQQVSQACQILTSRDPVVRHAATMRTQHEASLQRPKMKPMLVARDALKEDPSASGKKVRKVAKSAVVVQDAESRLEHAKSLVQQGELFRLVDDEASSAWSTAVLSLPPEQMKFALNASQDTLPHNSNLARWKNMSAACTLCGQRQTLQHVLNHCQVALDLRRYNARHDGVLDVIHSFVSADLPRGYQAIADLPDQAPYTFPPHIATTDSRPDLVVWNDATREVMLFELTVCFEPNFDDALLRKTEKYADLVQESQQSSFSVQMIPIQVGSRGFLDLRGFQKLRNLRRPQAREWRKFLSDIARAAISGSHRIWCTRNWKDSSVS